MKMTTVILSLVAMLGTARAELVNFDKEKVDATPAGWTGTKTGEGEAKWTVAADESAPSKPNVFKQSGQATYPLALKEDSNLKDGFVEVKFKPVAGKEDQAAGVVWRVKDANNYYIARANSLEENVRIYHFVNGKRTQFKGVGLEVPSGQWHTLRVNFKGSKFSVILNGKELFSAEDETIKDSGKVGLWTKADSVIAFDDFRYGAE